ncbi:MAG: DsrE family protein [Candidatus Bathyarchaeia archaeon]
MDKLLVIIATGDRDKALTGLMYAKNAIKREWLPDVKLIYFGPSEKLMVEDSDVRDAALEAASLAECFACKAISDREEISHKVGEMGIKVEYVGSIISDFIKEGYQPMVW